MTAVLLSPVQRIWKCPSCGLVDRKDQAPEDKTAVMHNCAVMNGLSLPLVLVNHEDDTPDARHVVIEREEYQGDTRNPIVSAVRTDHGDGSNDVHVLADLPHLTSKENEL